MTWAAIRIALALGGFLLAVLAVALEAPRVGWAAIAALLGSVLVRLAVRRDREL